MAFRNVLTELNLTKHESSLKKLIKRWLLLCKVETPADGRQTDLDGLGGRPILDLGLGSEPRTTKAAEASRGHGGESADRAVGQK